MIYQANINLIDYASLNKDVTEIHKSLIEANVSIKLQAMLLSNTLQKK